MQGLSTSEFDRKLRKLNPSLRVDRLRGAEFNGDEYPVCGLYKGDKFIIGVPQRYAPTYSIASVDFKLLEKYKMYDEIKYLDKYGEFPPSLPTMEFRLLWRGYKAIIAQLIRLNHIDRCKAEKEFRCSFEPGRYQFPMNFIHQNIGKI